jgi:hypothetical protein
LTSTQQRWAMASPARGDVDERVERATALQGEIERRTKPPAETGQLRSTFLQRAGRRASDRGTYPSHRRSGLRVARPGRPPQHPRRSCEAA